MYDIKHMITKNTQIHSEERITEVNRPKGSAMHKQNTFNILCVLRCCSASALQNKIFSVI